MRSLIFAALIALLGCLSTFVVAGPYVVAPVTLKATNYQKWAHYHWAWVKNSDGNQQNVTALMKGYQEHNIPLGAVNIDSTWATQFNNFEVDTTRFPDFAGLVKDLHDNGLKVILW
jgi:alpha-glucosidase (family GH31 glycosyl hydrolase)